MTGKLYKNSLLSFLLETDCPGLSKKKNIFLFRLEKLLRENMDKKVDTEAQKTPQVPQKKIVEVYVDTTWCQHGD